MARDFELIPHTADIQVRSFGATREELFKNALVGMFQAVRPQSKGCEIVDDRVVCDALPARHEITVDAPDINALLVDFLSEALYLSDVHNQAYLDVIIHELTDTEVRATLRGVRVTGFEAVEIKAVTYHGLDVKQVDGQWQVDVVLDI